MSRKECPNCPYIMVEDEKFYICTKCGTVVTKPKRLVEDLWSHIIALAIIAIVFGALVLITK